LLIVVPRRPHERDAVLPARYPSRQFIGPTDASGVKTVHTNNNRPRFFVPRTVCAANKLPVIKLPHGRPKSCKTYRKDILAIAARNGAVNVRVFGSVARCDNNPTAI
jgi:hypothetical protein